MITPDWKEAAEEWLKNFIQQHTHEDEVSPMEWAAPEDIGRDAFIAGASHGYEVGNIEADTQWSEKVLELEAANIKFKQQVETYRDAIKDKDLAYSLMKEACEDFKQQLAEMKWEYENACKFATQFEQQRDKLKAELDESQAVVETHAAEITRCYADLEREREANAKLREALESIAANHTPALTDIAYWLSVGQHECAETLANDTQIAREALLAAKQHTPSEDEELHNAFVKHLKAKEAKQDEGNG